MSRIAQLALAAAAIVAAGSALLPAVSPAADLEFYQEQNLGTRAHQRFLGKIVHRFDYQVLQVFNERLRATRYDPKDERHLISGRYCRTDAVLSDGQARDIWYLIEGRRGFAGIGDDVDSAAPTLIANSMTVAAVSGRETPTADQVLE